MAFLKLPEGVENITLSRAGTGKPRLGIFDSSKEKVLSDLDVGIAEAKGRYEEGAAGPNNPRHSERLEKTMDRPFASTCWAPQTVRVDPKDVTKGYKPKVNPATGEELVRVYIKCKGAIVDGLLTDIGGNSQKHLQIDANALVKTLEGYRAMLADMEKDSDLGKFWHNAAVSQSFPPKQKATQKSVDAMAHCMEADRWVKKGDVTEASPYPVDKIKPRI